MIICESCESNIPVGHIVSCTHSTPASGHSPDRRR